MISIIRQGSHDDIVPRLFDFFSRGEKPESEVDLPDVEEWLSSRIDEEFKEVYTQGDAILQRLKDACPRAKAAAEEFAKADIKTGELNQPLIPTIRNSKDSIASKVANTVSKMEFPKVKDFDSLIETSKNISQSLAQIDQTLKTHGRVVFTILNKEVRPLLSELKQMQRDAARFSKLVENNSVKAEEIRKIRLEIARLLNLNSELRSARMAREEAIGGSEEFKDGERKIAKTLEEVRRSKDYEDSLRISEEVKNLNLKLRSLKAEFDTAFSKLRKPLEKYGYTEHLNKVDDRLLKKYVESPSTGLTDDKDLVLDRFLGALKDMVNKEKISVKNPEKVLHRIDELRPTLKNKQDTIKKMADDLENMRASLKKTPIKKVEDIQKSLDEKRHAKEEQITFIEKKQSDIKEIAETLKKRASEVEEDVTETLGVRLKIKGMVDEED